MLTKVERFLLVSLGEDGCQYGECYGKTLDGLIEKGLAIVGGEETGLNNNYIAKGNSIMYRSVTLTEAGRAELSNEG